MSSGTERIERKLAAIFAADVAGYSRLMSQDEVGTLRALTSHREIIDRFIAENRGRIANTAGDSILAEFPSVVDAVQCAVTVQERLAEVSAGVPEERALRFRIGVHVGDVMVQGGDLLGDGVNVAARLESLADPGGVCVSGRAYEEIEGKLNIAFEDRGEQQVKNIARPVRVYALAGAAPARGKPEAAPLPEKPSIAVLPFENMSSDPEQSFFGDGISEDIITALSHISALLVIARTSTFAFKGKARDLREVGRELGARYILEGSVRRSGNRIRVTAQLIDAVDGSHLWADRYDRSVTDVFDIQDELTREIVTALRVALTDGEQARVWQRSTDDVSAWADAMRGFEHLWRGTAADMETARKFFTAAVGRDPKYARAFAAISLTHYFDIRFGYTNKAEEAQQSLKKHLQSALSLNPEEPYAVSLKALDLSMAGDFETALETARRAAEISPNDAFCWLTLARISVNAEHLEDGERAIRTAMHLNPLYPINYLAVLADALVHQGRDAKALEVLTTLLKRNPNYVSAYLHLAGLYARSGDSEAACKAIAEVLRINPTYRLGMARRFYLSSDKERQEAFVEALRDAGLPE